MAKKRTFHCAVCGSPCEIYKKGKKHRVIVCSRCGVIASNPIPLAAAAAPILKAVGGYVAGKVAGRAIESVSGGEDVETSSRSPPCATRRRSLAPYYVDKALG